MKDYLLTSKVFSVEDAYYHVSVTAAAADKPHQGVISRHHDCYSIAEVEAFLDILMEQVAEAVAATGGRVGSTRS